MTSKILELDTIEYPDSDGEPMSDNTEQFKWITLIKCELEAIFIDNLDVFVGGDLLWYPVQYHPEIRRAPDTMVAFDRPKGYRGSYKQWEENNSPPHVVFEILSPGNTSVEMELKRKFYRKYGVEEYYEYDPDRGEVRGWQRKNNRFLPILKMAGWVSPRLKIRFELINGELQLFRPDGQPFRSHVELDFLAKEERYEKILAQERAERERLRAERERERAEQAELAVEQERQRVEKLLAQLRALGHEPEE